MIGIHEIIEEYREAGDPLPVAVKKARAEFARRQEALKENARNMNAKKKNQVPTY